MYNGPDQFASAQDLQNILQLISVIKSGLSASDGILSALQAAIADVIRFREALKKGEKALDFADFVKSCYVSDRILHECLSNVELKKFELGRLWLQAKDNQDKIRLEFIKDSLLRILKDRYGVDFKVRIKPPEQMKDAA